MTLFVPAAPPPLGLLFSPVKALGITGGWGRAVEPGGEKSDC